MRPRRAVLSTLLLALSAGLAAPLATAEDPSSGGYRIEGGTFNAGGRPASGEIATSANFQLTIDAVGNALAHRPLSSASFSAESGFPSLFPPAGEVMNLRFADAETLLWSAEPAALSYRAYRDDLSSLGGLVGSCLASGIVGTSTTDDTLPDPGSGFLYLITAVDRLAEEGSAGSASSGAPRALAVPCP